MTILGFRHRHMRRAIARARLFACLKHWRRANKARLVWLWKLQGLRQIKQQRSLSFTFCKTQRSSEKIIFIIICYFFGSVVRIVLSEATIGGVLYRKVFLKFSKFTGKCKCQILFFNKNAGAATSVPMVLKSGSHLLIFFFIFASMIVLQKWWKMLFISS